FGPVVIDNAQSAILALVVSPDFLAHFSDIGELAFDDEELALLNLGQLDFVQGVDGVRLADVGFQLTPYALKERLERIKIRAWFALGYLFRSAFLSAGADMTQSGDVVRALYAGEFSQQFVFVNGLRQYGCGLSTDKQPLAIQRCKQTAAVSKRSQAVEAHGVEPLKYIAAFPVLRRTAMFLDEPLYLLESGDDALFA